VDGWHDSEHLRACEKKLAEIVTGTMVVYGIPGVVVGLVPIHYLAPPIVKRASLGREGGESSSSSSSKNGRSRFRGGKPPLTTNKSLRLFASGTCAAGLGMLAVSFATNPGPPLDATPSQLTAFATQYYTSILWGLALGRRATADSLLRASGG
jgi:hypothetical protein